MQVWCICYVAASLASAGCSLEGTPYNSICTVPSLTPHSHPMLGLLDCPALPSISISAERSSPIRLGITTEAVEAPAQPAAVQQLPQQHSTRAVSMGDVANKDEAFKCLDIARAALKEGEHARAEKFAAKALKLYRCSQVRDGTAVVGWWWVRGWVAAGQSRLARRAMLQ